MSDVLRNNEISGGGVSVEVWMMSGRAYQTAEAKIDLEERIYGTGTKHTSLEA